MLHELYIPEGEHLTGTPWNVYPRPRMKRSSWLNLNGEWDFDVRDFRFPETYTRKILVPFCPESLLSGIREHFPEGSALCYCKFFTLPEGFNRGRVLLHIGAADQHLHCFVNDVKVGKHSGGYENITFDITDALQEGENQLRFRCFDDLRDLTMPYGKQVMNRGGMWYTPVSGIWQTVWLESVPEIYIEKLNVENRGYSVTITTEPKLDGTVHVKGLGSFPFINGSITITPENPRLWSPEDPFLYEFTLEAGEDRVESYFAIRSLEIKTFGKYPRLCLNGRPYFFHGLLDQGYWPEGLLTPPAPESYVQDILLMKKLGFNMLRKHIKVEMEEFYYQCDRLGMIVFQDMVNNGEYRYFRDTVLPNVGIQKLNDKHMHRDENTRAEFLRCMESTVQQLKSHPSICCWTIFNEGWGQFDADMVYEKFRELDDTRFIDSTSGWWRRKKTDVDSRHVYLRKVRLEGDGEKPLVLSEFGGYVYKVEGHIFNPDKEYGYGGYDSLEAYREAVEKLYMEEILPCVGKGLCAAIYTQVSDVEDEVNGLLTYDRKVEKLTAERMLPVAEALQAAVSSRGM